MLYQLNIADFMLYEYPVYNTTQTGYICDAVITVCHVNIVSKLAFWRRRHTQILHPFQEFMSVGRMTTLTPSSRQ